MFVRLYFTINVLLFHYKVNAKICENFNVTQWTCEDYQYFFSDVNIAKTLSCIGYRKINHEPSKIKFARKIRELLKVDETEGYLTLYESMEMIWNEEIFNLNLCHTRLDHYFPPYSSLFWSPDFDTSSETLFEANLDRATLYQDGRIKLKNSDYMTKIRCHMNYEWYPFDTQTCSHPIVMDEYLDFIDFSFSEDKMLKESDIHKAYHPDWKISLKPNACPKRDENKVCFSVDLILERKTSNHILHIFVPSIMLSIASGTSLFIPNEYMPARMGLSVTTCLLMITLFVNAQ